MTVVSAPGKLMIAGEYAVLHGAQAIVAAVNRRAYARPADGAPTDKAEALAAEQHAAEFLGISRQGLVIDVTELHDGSRKLGLGSSAAAAAAAAGSMFARHGMDLSDPGVRQGVLDTALRGHRSIAPRGSGADVGAAVLGGVLRVRRKQDSLEAHALGWPDGLQVRVIWSGVAVRTSDLLDAVQSFQEHSPMAHGERMDALREGAEHFVSAWLDANPASIVANAEHYGACMAELGDSAGISIVDDTMKRIRSLARDQGGAAKPSGAGGGDVAIGFFADAAAADRFAAKCGAEGFDLLSIELGAEGVRVEPPTEDHE